MTDAYIGIITLLDVHGRNIYNKSRGEKYTILKTSM